MKKRKNVKKEARQVLKKNYYRIIAVAFFIMVALGTIHIFKSRITIPSFSIRTPFHYSFNADILRETIERVGHFSLYSYKPTRGILANIFNNITSSGSFIFGGLNSLNQLLFHERIWESLIILLGAILSFLYWFFIRNVLQVGEKRFYIENQNHKKTYFTRIFLPYRIKKLKSISLTMFYKTVVEWLSYLTIFGGFYIHYSYLLVPYILAENPGIYGKEAIQLSKDLMKGHKWELFKFDLSFIGWTLLDICTLHFLGVLYVRPYKECCLANYYFQIRSEGIKKKVSNYKFLCDKELLKKEDHYSNKNYLYPIKSTKKWFKPDYNRDYSLSSYILMFFTASIIGWLWEVGLNLFQYGFFANRGTLHGPWLHIYGWGLLLILISLKRFRKQPVLTFVLVMVLCGALEYGTAWYLETFKHARWWDYDGFFLNLHGRICLEGLLAFGVGGILFIYYLAPLLDSLYAKIPKKIKLGLCIILSILYVFDFAYSSKHPNIGDGVAQSLQIKNVIQIE